jgi:hypothetical protein
VRRGFFQVMPQQEVRGFDSDTLARVKQLTLLSP